MTMSIGAHELELYIVNDGQIYERSLMPIYKNLATKKARGEYVHDLAIKAFMYTVNEGAKRYTREYSAMTDKWDRLFSMKERLEVAEALARYFETEWKLGQFRQLLPKKYQGTV